MYQFLDRKISELDAPAGFVLGAIRMWVSAVQAGRCPCGMIANHFAKAGLHVVASDFGMAMFTLNCDGLQQLHLAHPGCPSIRDDEARLLALFTSAIDGDRPMLAQLAATLVHDNAIPRLIQATSIVAAHVAASLVSTRFDVSPRFD